MDDVTCKLGDIGKMVCLSGEPRRRVTEQGMGKRFMIGVQGKLSGFKKESKITDRGVSCKEFTVEGEIFGFCGG